MGRTRSVQGLAAPVYLVGNSSTASLTVAGLRGSEFMFAEASGVTVDRRNLKLRNCSWYVRFKVPQSLRKIVGEVRDREGLAHARFCGGESA